MLKDAFHDDHALGCIRQRYGLGTTQPHGAEIFQVLAGGFDHILDRVNPNRVIGLLDEPTQGLRLRAATDDRDCAEPMIEIDQAFGTAEKAGV